MQCVRLTGRLSEECPGHHSGTGNQPHQGCGGGGHTLPRLGYWLLVSKTVLSLALTVVKDCGGNCDPSWSGVTAGAPPLRRNYSGILSPPYCGVAVVVVVVSYNMPCQILESLPAQP